MIESLASVSEPSLMERFQTAIATSLAAILGFAGIILTIWANYRRDRRERQEIRLQEKQVLLAALRAEISLIKDHLERSMETARTVSTKQGFIHASPAKPHRVLDHLLGKLGLLNPVIAAKVLNAYMSWEEIPERLLLQIGSDSAPPVRDSFILVEGSKAKIYTNVIAECHGPITDALEALDREQRIT